MTLWSGKVQVRLAVGLGALVLILGGLGLAALLRGGPSRDVSYKAQTHKSVESESVPIGTGVGERAPDFVLTDLRGRTIRLSELRGWPTVLFFSAAWCLSCAPQSQELAKFQTEYPDRLKVIWIDVNPGRDTPEDLRRYMQQYGHEAFFVALDTSDNEVARLYRVRALGQTYLLDERGIIVQAGVGAVFSPEFRRALQELIQQGPTSTE